MTIAIRESHKGRAVFATEFIYATQTLEIAPFVHITAEQREIMKRMDFGEYPFADPIRYKPHLPCRGFVVFGLMSFINHWWEPNAIVSWELNAQYAKLVALSNIYPGDEITIRYTDIDEYEDIETWSAPLKGLASSHAGPQVPLPDVSV